MKTTALSTITLGITMLISCNQQESQSAAPTYTQQYPLNAPSYVCYKVANDIKVDGKLSEGEWDAIPWTTDFIDIEGDKRPAPLFQTRAKMAHNDQGMYFAVLMEEPHVWGTITKHDTVIFHDNDFEIFLNPTSDTHNYLEYEINALGTDWDLFLSKPYRDRGCVVLNNWEFAGMQSAVYVDGTINNPADTDRSWSVEVFIPWKSIYQVMRHDGQPKEGEQIRVNFSRVEWTTQVENGQYTKIPMPGEDKIREYNWVWAPTGRINIHLPEYWGYVQFTQTLAGTKEVAFTKNPDEDIKWALLQLYYRQAEYAKTNGAYATNIGYLKPEEVCPAEWVQSVAVHNTPSMYEITATVNGKQWHIKHDGLVWVDNQDKTK